MKAIAKFFENVLGILIYAIVFILFLGIANIGWLVVYHKNQEKFMEIEKE